MKANKEDLEALQGGFPPKDPDLIEYLTVPNEWLELMKNYCLNQVIAAGGSKVKILYGGKATGKSHFLQALKVHAAREGFFAIDLDISQISFHLTDSVAFYKAVVAQVDLEKLEETLSSKILDKLGYNLQDFTSFGGALMDYLCEREQSNPEQAKKDIRTCVHSIVNSLELEFSFRKFMHMFMEAVVEKDKDFMAIARDWIRGEKIASPYKRSSMLHETLAKHNARSWLYSLVEILKFMGYKGVIILLDQFEAILPKSEAVVHYTPMRRNDVYELIRQLIDDMDFFPNTLIVISGSREIFEDEKHGLASYHALWMRIQPGFEQLQNLNVYSDLIDSDLIFHNMQLNGQMEPLKQKLLELGVQPPYAADDRETNRGFDYQNFRELLSTKGFWTGER
ncbi:MAG: DUF2791 family P-loop domain-containing protein [Candidatus Cloacimonetes bacterium]|nr:DUF2791 family P-loop domain-containing protein [Candidatus Cloacimonadota bacterium]